MKKIILLILGLLFFNLGFGQAPTISSFSPQSGPVGTTVTITGTNFGATTAENIVFFGATKATVTVASSTSLTVTVPIGATYEPISVLNGSTVLFGYSREPFVTTFTPNKGTIANSDMSSAVNFSTGFATYLLCIVDFDGDGKSDIAVNNRNSNLISIFRNTSVTGTISSSSFTTPVNITSPNNPGGIAAGDLDGDGKPDLVVTNVIGSNISVLLNTSSGAGDISFAAAVILTSAINPLDVKIGDIDGDGKADLTLVSNNNALLVYRNISSGSGNINFAPYVSFPSSATGNALVLADIDGDTKVDALVANLTSSGTASVFNNISTIGVINFAARVSFPTGPNPNFISVGDINKDGKIDFAVSNSTTNTVSVFRNLSSGPGNISFDTKVDLSTNGNAKAVTIADIDGDGGIDIAACTATGFLSVFHNTNSVVGAAASFAAKVDFISSPGDITNAIAVGDLDGDGKNDVVISNTTSSNISVLRNTPLFSNISTLNNLTISQGTLNPVFATGTTNYTATVSNATSSMTVTPVVTNNTATVTVNGIAVLSGNASGAIALVTGPNVIPVVVTAQDGITTTTYTVTVTRVGPPVITTFSPQNGPVGTTVTITGTNFGATATDNIVFFGAVKAVITAATSTSITVTVPVGTTYEPISVLNTTTVLAGYSSLPFSTNFTPNKGKITIDDITPQVDFATAGTSSSGITIGDFDGDGKADLAINNIAVPSISIYRNISASGSITSASFAAKVDFAVTDTPRKMAVGDFDGDGKLDIVAVNFGTSLLVSVLRNTSSGTGNINFAAQMTFAVAGANPLSVGIADIDGDGKIDLAVGNNIGNTVSVLRNTSSGIGNINFAAKIDFPSDFGPADILMGDLDGDNKTDMITTNNRSTHISVYRNTSTTGVITFAPIQTFTTGTSPLYGAIGDLNKDGKLDIAVANNGSNSISVFLNTSSGSGNINFDTTVNLAIGNIQVDAAISDIDGDGMPDLVASSSAFLHIMRNTATAGGSLSFATPLKIPSTTGTSDLVLGDLDGDGKDDIAVNHNTGSTISVFRNSPLFAPTVQATNVVFSNTTGIATTATWVNGNGASRAVFVYAGASGSPLPLDSATYTANAIFGTGTQIGTTGWYCVYNGTGTTVTITGLTANTNYQVMTVEYNGSVGNELYFSTVATGNPAAVTTLNNVATLSNLSVSEGTLIPVFASGTLDYTFTVPNASSSLTVTPVTTDTNATVTVNGTAVISGDASGSIALAVGSNVITTIVTAQDGTTTQTYTITVTRTAPPTILVTDILPALTATYGTASTSAAFNISGTDMFEGIVVTSPLGFEVSTDDITFTNTLTIGAAGVIASTPVYI
ncbi:beta strand repeat-containing protein [Flavobacterium sp. N1736]|uniref:beta strand repeat-containing protein n=1 Tax=Flavobacterium sp. N1736 TaxID=2986823 RepID=UPI0022249EFB|nr:FG-GAP-like repeat-containing protein [Flavobacterium sp. N1736]